MKKLFLWVSFIVFFAAHAAAQVKVTAKIDSAEILIDCGACTGSTS